ncbi:MAG: hypothetical protein AAF621_07005 [Pseudomonadota bacterium]
MQQFPGNFFNNNVIGPQQDYTGALNNILSLTNGTSNLGINSALNTATYSYLTALNDSYGIQQQDAINEYANRANVYLDLEQLALRTNYGIMQKQLEMSVLDEQVREKLFGTFFEIEKVKMDNTFQRAKSIVQAAKY